jgi:RNA polymerase primary sigma factor
MEEQKYLNKSIKMDYYRQQMFPLKHLTEEEEKELIIRVKADDKQAKEQLIKSYFALVISIAKKFSGTVRNFSGVGFDDLIQEGNIGLMIAAEKYDSDYGLRFATYAKVWITQRITGYLKDCGRDIRLPRPVVNQLMRYTKVTDGLSAMKGKKPKEEEIAEFMGIKPEKLKQLHIFGQNISSIDTTVTPAEDDEEDGSSIMQILADEKTPSAEEQTEQNMLYEDKITEMKNKLSANEQKIMFTLLDAYGDRVPRSVREAALLLGISSGRVHQLQKKALSKLQIQKIPVTPKSPENLKVQNIMN